MEQMYNDIKNFIIAHGSDFTAKSTTDLTVDAPKEKDFVFGVADLLKIKNKLVVAIKPESQNETNDDFIDDELVETEWTVAFICRQNIQDKLDKLVCRYADAFREIAITDCCLDGTCAGSRISTRNYFFNAGGLEMQMSAVEITFTTITSIN